MAVLLYHELKLLFLYMLACEVVKLSSTLLAGYDLLYLFFFKRSQSGLLNATQINLHIRKRYLGLFANDCHRYTVGGRGWNKNLVACVAQRVLATNGVASYLIS